MWTVSLILIFMKRVVQMGFMMTFREGIEATKSANLHIIPTTSTAPISTGPWAWVSCPDSSLRPPLLCLLVANKHKEEPLSAQPHKV